MRFLHRLLQLINDLGNSKRRTFNFIVCYTIHASQYKKIECDETRSNVFLLDTVIYILIL